MLVHAPVPAVRLAKGVELVVDEVVIEASDRLSVRTAHADGEDSGGCGTACKQPLGAILARPREYLVRVVLPSLVPGWPSSA
jgi:hypothetical protein